MKLTSSGCVCVCVCVCVCEKNCMGRPVEPQYRVRLGKGTLCCYKVAGETRTTFLDVDKLSIEYRTPMGCEEGGCEGIAGEFSHGSVWGLQRVLGLVK